jgi:hypothetical protein
MVLVTRGSTTLVQAPLSWEKKQPFENNAHTVHHMASQNPKNYFGLVRLRWKTSCNTVPTDFLWEKNTVPAEKISWKVRIISRLNRAFIQSTFTQFTTPKPQHVSRASPRHFILMVYNNTILSCILLFKMYIQISYVASCFGALVFRNKLNLLNFCDKREIIPHLLFDCHVGKTCLKSLQWHLE